AAWDRKPTCRVVQVIIMGCIGKAGVLLFFLRNFCFVLFGSYFDTAFGIAHSCDTISPFLCAFDEISEKTSYKVYIKFI
ncbi:MAG TPA: hypothetical protein K8V27_04510, partial [Butyricicoccus pullicaecorum]|nr:hypothetical protein [Butyricicoccus pullicaecorum]